MKEALTRFCLRLFMCVLVTVAPLTAAKAVDPSRTEVLELAEAVARWMDSIAVTSEDGVSWPDDALQPEVASFDLGRGVAGKVLFYISLYRATADEQYLETALRGADSLAAVLQRDADFDGLQHRASLYSGIAGMGVAIHNVHQYVKKPRYAAALTAIVQKIDEWAIEHDDSSAIYWSSGWNDLLYGDAGTVLFLAYMGHQTGNQNALDLARRGADSLLLQAQTAAAGSYWLFRRDKDFNLPNFSHGTAGIAYVLETMAQLTGERRYADAALASVSYLNSIAIFENDEVRIPYGWPLESWANQFAFGWAHGLAGTALLYERVSQGSREDVATEILASIKQTLVSIDLPATPRSPFSEASMPLDMRFGRASVLRLIADWNAEDSLPAEGLELQNAIWQQLRDAAIRDDDGVHWEVVPPAFMGDGPAAYSGYLHGAAGIGLALLRLHARLGGRQPYVSMPDDPFAWPIEAD